MPAGLPADVNTLALQTLQAHSKSLGDQMCARIDLLESNGLCWGSFCRHKDSYKWPLQVGLTTKRTIPIGADRQAENEALGKVTDGAATGCSGMRQALQFLQDDCPFMLNGRNC